jgi:putative phage-type endonuclease
MTPVLIPAATEAEWLEARRHGVTASEIAVVMGLSPYDSPFALYHRKRGDLPPIEDTDAMALGRHMESFIAARFADRHPEFALMGSGRELFADPDRPWQMATPDRFVCERLTDPGRKSAYGTPVAVLECKIDAGSDGWGEDGSDEIPVHYRCQVLWQCRVMQVTNWYLACLDWRSRKIRIYEGVIDGQARDDLTLMEDEAAAFLSCIAAGVEPDPDWRPATTAALKYLHPSVEDRDAVVGVRTAISYRAACRRYKQAERRKNEMTNRLRAEMGSGARAVTRRGDAVATRQVYEVREHTRKAATVDKLIPVHTKDQT